MYLSSLVGWGTDQRGFGEEPGMKTQVLNLIRSIRTVMRSEYNAELYTFTMSDREGQGH